MQLGALTGLACAWSHKGSPHNGRIAPSIWPKGSCRTHRSCRDDPNDNAQGCRMTTNPLLADTDLPDFAAIRPEHMVPAVEHMIADARAAADRIGGSNASDFADVVLASERAGFAIARGWSP